MKKLIIAIFLGLGLVTNVSAATTKKVCKVTVDKSGNKMQQCKITKIHKKLNGTKVPNKK